MALALQTAVQPRRGIIMGEIVAVVEAARELG